MLREDDYIQQLADYIKKNLSKGYTLESLKIALEHQDYSRTSIERAIELANEQLADSLPQMKEKPKIKYQVLDENEKPASIEKEKSKENKISSKLKKLFE